MQKLKGIWIPIEIITDEKLSDKEVIILSMILYLSTENGTCFVSNKYISSIVNVTPDRVSKIISSLKKKKYIDIKLKYKTNSKEIEERQIIPIFQAKDRYSQKHLEGIGENNYSNSRNQPYPLGEKDKDIINNYNNINKYNNGTSNNKKYKSNYEGRDYAGFDFTRLYANAEAFK